MLTVSTIESNVSITTDIVNSGKYLTAVNGSMLSDLVNSSLPLLPDNVNELTTPAIIELIEASTYSDMENFSLHTELVDKYISLLANNVSGHIKVAKEIVVPIYKQITQEITEYSNALSLKDTMNDINIIMYKKPLVADNSTLLDMIENYKGLDIITPNFITINSKTKEEILLLCTVGNSSLDNDILNHLSNLDSSAVVETYDLLFNYTNSTLERTAIENLNGFEKFSKALIGFLVARRLYDSVPEGLQMDLTSYRTTISNIRDYCGTLLVTAIMAIEQAMNTNALVLNIDRANKVIKVNDVVYKKWLETNNEEAILGILVSDRTYSTLDVIQSKKEQLVEQWKNYNTYYSLRKEKDNFKSLKDMLLATIYNSVKEENLTDIEREYMAVNPNHTETIKNLSSAFVEKLTTNDLNDLNQVCLELVANCRFHFTSSYTILKGMHEVEKINPDINPREAALISVINYVTDYFIDQVKVENITGGGYGV